MQTILIDQNSYAENLLERQIFRDFIDNFSRCGECMSLSQYQASLAERYESARDGERGARESEM